ncbi:hypothetical protein CUJ91_14955 [Paraburkholderia graminis]|nr:hypothetical protein CUJ91_14955 [Paraburkholderia graminis]
MKHPARISSVPPISLRTELGLGLDLDHARRRVRAALMPHSCPAGAYMRRSRNCIAKSIYVF